MNTQQITFDHVFKKWLDCEIDQVEGRDLLPVANAKGFSSITEWRLATALRLGMAIKEWRLETIFDPNAALPDIIIGPFQGWSLFFENKLETTFKTALQIPEFFDWCSTHDRIIPLANNFPLPTFLILFRKPNGDLIHIEGGHRICAASYRKKIGQPLDFENKPNITAAVADINDSEILKLQEFLKQGTFKQ